jgi:hypothetical protein
MTIERDKEKQLHVDTCNDCFLLLYGRVQVAGYYEFTAKKGFDSATTQHASESILSFIHPFVRSLVPIRIVSILQLFVTG